MANWSEYKGSAMVALISAGCLLVPKISNGPSLLEEIEQRRNTDNKKDGICLFDGFIHLFQDMLCCPVFTSRLKYISSHSILL